jgi:hypothetical protein
MQIINLRKKYPGAFETFRLIGKPGTLGEKSNPFFQRQNHVPTRPGIRSWNFTIALVLLSAVDLSQTLVARAGYTYTSMLPADYYTTSAANYVAINNLGEVASIGYINGNDQQIAISNGSQTIGILNPPADNSLGEDIWLNDAGQVVARSDSTIFTAAQGSYSPLNDTTGYVLNDDNFVAANVTNSPIAWVGYNPVNFSRDLFLTSGTTTRTLATTGSAYSDIYYPYMNASDTVCYTTEASTSTQTSVFVTNGTTTRTIAVASSNDRDIEADGIDNNGDVLWNEYLTNGNQNLWLTSPTGTNTLIANTTGAYQSFSDPYSFAATLSPSGQVAFIATLKNGNVGIFTGSDPVADKVIQEGDPLFGGTVGSVISFSPQGLNDNGSLAFLADTQNGSYVVRADPVPEPASCAVLVAGNMLLMIRGRRNPQ